MPAALKRQMKSWAILSHLLRRSDWRKLSRARILAVRHDNDCGQLIDGKFYCPLIDSIADEIDKAAILTIASPYSTRVGSQSYAAALSFNGAFSRDLFRRRIGTILGQSVAEAELDTWREIIRVVQPKYLITIQPPAVLCRACHEEGVSVFDVQHGYIGPNNPGYGQDFQSGRRREELPDCILCWDAGSADSIRKWTTERQIELRVIGNPWINKFARRRENDPVIRYFDQTLDFPATHGTRSRILVSLQWGLADPVTTPNQELFDNEFMPLELEKAILHTQADFEWILRPHPIQHLDAELFSRLALHVRARFGSGVRIAAIEPLPFLLSLVDLHVTYNSSVVIEAESFGVQSAILDPQVDGGIWGEYFSTQISNGTARILRCDARMIKDWIAASTLESAQRRQRPTIPPAYAAFLRDVQAP